MSVLRAERLMRQTSGDRGLNELRCSGCSRRIADIVNEVEQGSARIEAVCRDCKSLTVMRLKAV